MALLQFLSVLPVTHNSTSCDSDIATVLLLKSNDFQPVDVFEMLISCSYWPEFRNYEF